jgi:hypothetical protein
MSFNNENKPELHPQRDSKSYTKTHFVVSNALLNAAEILLVTLSIYPYFSSDQAEYPNLS